MESDSLEFGDEHRAQECLEAFAVSLFPQKAQYFNRGKVLRELLLGTSKWHPVRCLVLGRQLEQVELAHKLIEIAIRDAMMYRGLIGKNPRACMVHRLNIFAKWVRTANNGTGALMSDKIGPIWEAIEYLKEDEKSE